MRVARIFNTYGPRMHMSDGRVVSNFILQALQNQDMTVYGKGDQTRSFQYVSDLVSGLIALMNSDETSPINIGNPTELTMMDFAKNIKAITNSTSEIVQKKPATDDPQKRKPDISKAKEILNWEPKVSLEDGLAKTIAYFKAELEQESGSERNMFLPDEL